MTEKERILDFLSQYSGSDVCVAFSGGADSALVLFYALLAAKEHGTKVYAACISTKLHPTGEISEAKKMAEDMGAEFLEIFVDEFENAGIKNNPVDRCYRCKKYMFTELKALAKSLNASVIYDGTNFDDTKVYRPGIKALKELGIISPLCELRIEKATVRSLLSDENISVANKPSAPCLATRFPYDTELTEDNLRRVENAELAVKAFGLSNVRVRVHGDLARIEIDRFEEEKLLNNRDAIVDKLLALGYDYVTYDLEGFKSGSMDKKVGVL